MLEKGPGGVIIGMDSRSKVDPSGGAISTDPRLQAGSGPDDLRIEEFGEELLAHSTQKRSIASLMHSEVLELVQVGRT